MFFSPLVASLSDQIGRKHLMTWGRIGWGILNCAFKMMDLHLK